MSLFKSREWWSAECGTGDENFDGTHICLAGGAKDTRNHVIIVGSREGFLRIFDPHCEPSSSASENKPIHSSDMLLETQLPHPILAVQSGRFSKYWFFLMTIDLNCKL